LLHQIKPQSFNLFVMTTQNTTQATISTSYVMTPAQSEVKVVVSKKSTEINKENAVKPVATFAKNLRYSLNSNGGGYAGL
jgi:hypothetical protein